MALGAALAGSPLGTPAGNSQLTQEQIAYLRAGRMRYEDIEFIDVLVAATPPCPGEIPEDFRAQAELVEMPCPIVGKRLVDGAWIPAAILLPCGHLSRFEG